MNCVALAEQANGQEAAGDADVEREWTGAAQKEGEMAAASSVAIVQPCPWDGRPRTDLDGKACKGDASALVQELVAHPTFDIWGFGAQCPLITTNL